MFTISTTTAPGKTLFSTLERLGDGYLWNSTAGAWQASPSAVDARAWGWPRALGIA